ncbi:TMEM175 family protein [Lentilactobacillus sp. SPB1-3]|uniref:TMEM175 family protein n=1 Tax=Lentilactobacillus terminaliae TaxID=3003483 RepID=A0ACD5DH48_9LACO|nr:TMEM175 family protein [Lentilactobacillus sp. SPB1-3]MCZ0976816.1 TMEM175 family protein [Lentilactobacillus sp. SPB1-3]
MNKNRMEALTDGIIAIAATIMVLEIHAPDSFTFESLRDQVPAMIAYLISFLLVMLSWYSYHLMFLHVKRVDLRVYLANTIWLLVLTGIPFATSWVGRFSNNWQPELTYLLITALWAIMYTVTSHALERANPELKKSVNQESVMGIIFRYTMLVGSLILLPFWPPIGLFSTLVLMIISLMFNFRDEKRAHKNHSI